MARRRRKRVLFVLSELDLGGPQKSLLALFERIDFDQLDVYVYLIQPGGSLVPYLDDRVHLLASNELISAVALPSRGTLNALTTLLKHRRFGIFFAGVRAILKYLMFRTNMNQERQAIWRDHHDELPKIDGEYDLVFGIQGLASYCAVDCVSAAKRFHWIRSDARVLRRDELIDGEYYRLMDGALSVSQTSAEIFEQLYPFMRGRVTVFHNHIPVQLYDELPADLSMMKCPKGCVRILTVCRLDPLKGLDLAVAACRLLVRAGLSVRWFVLGDGVMREQIERMIQDANLDGIFVLLGFELNTMAFIEQCDVFVHPSRTEGKANVVDEAKFAGKPVVATDYDTVGDQIEDGVTGIICAMDAEAIAESISRLVNSPELAERIAHNSMGHEDGIADVTGFLVDLCEAQS